MRALITGSSVFLGDALARTLRARGIEVLATARHARAGVLALDVTDATAVATAVDACDLVFHLAASRARAIGELDETVRVNTLGAANVLAAAARARRPPRTVLVGSSEEYGGASGVPFHEDGAVAPISAYGASKLAATNLAVAAAHVVPCTVVRPAVIYGPCQPAHQLVAAVVAAAVVDGECTINGGGQTRDFVFVDDVALALVAAAERAGDEARGRIVNVGSGTEVSALALAQRVIALAGSGRLLIGAPSSRPGDVARSVLDVERAARWLGWRATTSLDDGLSRTLAHARDARH